MRPATCSGPASIETVTQLTHSLLRQERKIGGHDRSGEPGCAGESQHGLVDHLCAGSGRVQPKSVVPGELLVVTPEVQISRRVELLGDVLDGRRSAQELRDVPVAGPDATVAREPVALDGAGIPLLGVGEVREEGEDRVWRSSRRERALHRDHPVTLATTTQHGLTPRGAPVR